jgi:hypothetical protein
MATILVSIICIAMIVVGGITLSHGILTSTDTAALSVDEISVREGEIARTRLDILRAEYLSWADLLRVTVENVGQTKLACFDKWDLIVRYSDGGSFHTLWLPYTTGGLHDDEWQKARIGLNGPLEYFEPGILNPGEELVMLAKLGPLPGDNTTGELTVVSPNGIFDSVPVINPGYALLVPHSENVTLSGTRYYEMAEAAPADGAATPFQEEFGNGESGRKILVNSEVNGRPARHIFPLIGIEEIPASDWTVYYRCLASGDGQFPQSDGDVRFNIDILVRKADGTIRTTIASGVAAAYIGASEGETWLTKSANYTFPGYTVVDENDYLEIDYYGQTTQGPGGDSGLMELIVDDDTLPMADQTRIEAFTGG